MTPFPLSYDLMVVQLHAIKDAMKEIIGTREPNLRDVRARVTSTPLFHMAALNSRTYSARARSIPGPRSRRPGRNLMRYERPWVNAEIRF